MTESLEFTRCLLELPKVSVTDVRRIVRSSSATPQSLMDKGFKFYVCSYISSFEETEQKWHKPRTMGVKPGPVDAMVVIKARPGATATSGIRSSLYQAYKGELPVPSTLNPTAYYAGFEPDTLPLICKMNISADKPLVDSAFGKVQAGSVLALHHPPPCPQDCNFVPTSQEQLHLHSLRVTWSQSRHIAASTTGKFVMCEDNSLLRIWLRGFCGAQGKRH
ncbi:hypothetical protein WMY93_012051 [Mugilogobius chulae]|uniref:Uncharacterized protein n=1 Tax=Mugilogobius chulae TaxID=88201 RepID=A0AAW0P5M1_9GOBI